MKCFRHSLLSMVALSMLSTNSNAQSAASYSFMSSTKTYVPVTGGLTPYSPSNGSFAGDEERTIQQLGFSFNFAGQDYSQVIASTNCWLSLKSPVPTDPGGHEYFENLGTYANDIVAITPALFPFWDDMHGQSSGSAAFIRGGRHRNRNFTFEWKNWGYFEGNVANSLSMQ